MHTSGRPDTIHHIVTQLINEKSELAQEAQAPIVPEMEHEDYSDPKWIPDPPDAGPSEYPNTSGCHPDNDI